MTLQKAGRIALEGLACVAGFTTIFFWLAVLVG